MLDYIKREADGFSDDQMCDYLRKLFHKEAGDHTGLVYGMGHAVYTKSDPRAQILRENAGILAKQKGFEEDFAILEAVERLTPVVFSEIKGESKTVCANVDLYSGLVYRMLGIPNELYTPLFAVSRMAGWSAHRIEELTNCSRIIRPAYKAVSRPAPYIPLDQR
ncbi:MAG: citrate synthase, partial [Ruminococcaceae bacterium]|nr:citrate synthase [Oscillospiraceae bacterium]